MPYPCASQRRRLACIVTNSAAKPASNPREAPNPSHCGWRGWSHSVRVTLNSGGIRAADHRGPGTVEREQGARCDLDQGPADQARPEAQKDRGHQPGGFRREAAALEDQRDGRLAECDGETAAGHHRQRGQRNGRSIRRKASRKRNRLRKRAISGSSELEMGFTRMASGTPTPRMQYSSAAAMPGPACVHRRA